MVVLIKCFIMIIAQQAHVINIQHVTYIYLRYGQCIIEPTIIQGLTVRDL